MKDNENKVEETTETNDEELEETEAEEVDEETNEEDNEDGTPTIEDYQRLNEDYQRLKKEAETLKAQKEHWRKKAQTSQPKGEELKKSNETNVSEEDLIRTARLASQLDDDDLEVLKTLGGSLAEKINNPLFKAYKESKVKKQKSESASLKPSNGILSPKAKPNMTPEEHKAWVKKIMS